MLSGNKKFIIKFLYFSYLSKTKLTLIENPTFPDKLLEYEQKQVNLF